MQLCRRKQSTVGGQLLLSCYNQFISLWLHTEISQHPWWGIRESIYIPQAADSATAAHGATLHFSSQAINLLPQVLSGHGVSQNIFPQNQAGTLALHLSRLWLMLWSSGGSLQTQSHLKTVAAEGFWLCTKDAAANYSLYARQASGGVICKSVMWTHDYVKIFSVVQ